MHLPLIRRSFVSILLLLACSAIAFGQYRERALERARAVKMLTDDREAVRKTFHDFNLDDSDETTDEFSIGETRIEVAYSSGTCDEDEEVWNVSAGKIVRLEVWERSNWKRSDLKVDIASFEKEQVYTGVKQQVIYHSKGAGIAVEVFGDEIEGVFLFPRVTTKASICQTKYAKEFVHHRSWFGSKRLEDRLVCNWVNGHANVTDLALSHSEISATTSGQIEVATTAVDPENDILTYSYTVTGGRIIGAGAKVKWDFTGVRPGTYTITAGVDDGCGLCGATMTKTVVIK